MAVTARPPSRPVTADAAPQRSPPRPPARRSPPAASRSRRSPAGTSPCCARTGSSSSSGRSIQPFLLVFVFLYVFPTIGQGVGGAGRRGRPVGVRHRARPRRGRHLDHVPGHPGRRHGRWPRSSASPGRSRTACRRRARSGWSPWPRCSRAPCRACSPRSIVFPIAAVVHAPGVEAHLTVHWWIVLTLIPLACVAMSSLGLLLGTHLRAAQHRPDVRLRRAADHLPRRHLLPVDRARPGQGRRLVHWLQTLVLVNPLIYVNEGLRAGLTTADTCTCSPCTR